MMFVSNTIVFASASDNFDITNLPTEVKKKIEENLNTNEEPIQSLIENGIIMTRDEFNTFLSKSKSKDDVSVMAVPSDGYIYVYDSLYITDNQYKNYFKTLGSYTVTNKTGSPIGLRYEQGNTTTTTWSVAASISGSAKIGNDFLGKIQASTGVTVDRSKTTYAGTTFSLSGTCPPGRQVTVTAYQKGIYSTATTVYSKYTQSGSNVGAYYETVSGTVVNTNGVTLEAVESAIQ